MADNDTTSNLDKRIRDIQNKLSSVNTSEADTISLLTDIKNLLEDLSNPIVSSVNTHNLQLVDYNSDTVITAGKYSIGFDFANSSSDVNVEINGRLYTKSSQNFSITARDILYRLPEIELNINAGILRVIILE